ncbi:MAG: DNA polymerase IV [Acidimicrobiia bacterium]|nr:DNA polymerase IV [Acidimicrobiia bacterium]
MGRIAEHILHVDMDAFFVEAERLRDPSLVGVPVVVGGLGGRGVVASASYEARRSGVRSAMPISEARRRVPLGRFVVPDHDHYRSISDSVFEILRSFTPIVEGLSIDEAFLEVAGLGLHYEGAHEIATAVRKAILSELNLPSSAGAATTKLVAKLASERSKPDGQLVVAAGSELDFLRPLGLRALWGVGEATYAALEAIGVSAVGELADLPERMVRRRLGETIGAHLWALAHNMDDRAVTPGDGAKSISTEATFAADLMDPSRIDEELFRLCVGLSDRLRKAGVAARTVSVKVRYSDFSTITRSHTTTAPIDLAADLYATASELTRRAGVGERPVRLLGVAGTGLSDVGSPRQLGLGDDSRQALAEASDSVRHRFGEDAIRLARLVPPPDPERSESPPVY